MYRPCEVYPTCEHPEDPKGRVNKRDFCLKWEKREDHRTSPEDEFKNPYDGE